MSDQKQHPDWTQLFFGREQGAQKFDPPGNAAANNDTSDNYPTHTQQDGADQDLGSDGVNYFYGFTAHDIIDNGFRVLLSNSPVDLPPHVWVSLVMRARDVVLGGMTEHVAAPLGNGESGTASGPSASSALDARITGGIANSGLPAMPPVATDFDAAMPGTAGQGAARFGDAEFNFPSPACRSMDRAPPPALPSLPFTNIAPQDILHRCVFANCALGVAGSAEDIMQHIKAAHLVRTDHSGRVVPWSRRMHERVTCEWPSCGKPMYIQSLQKHVEALHLGMGATCPLCGLRLKRRDELRRHTKTCPNGPERGSMSAGAGGQHGPGRGGSFFAPV